MQISKSLLFAIVLFTLLAACGPTRPGDPNLASGTAKPAPTTRPGDGASPGAAHTSGPTASDSRLSIEEQKKSADGQKDNGIDVPPGRGTAGSGNPPPGTGNRP